jgi:hypothetical protein
VTHRRPEPPRHETDCPPAAWEERRGLRALRLIHAPPRHKAAAASAGRCAIRRAVGLSPPPQPLPPAGAVCLSAGLPCARFQIIQRRDVVCAQRRWCHMSLAAPGIDNVSRETVNPETSGRMRESALNTPLACQQLEAASPKTQSGKVFAAACGLSTSTVYLSVRGLRGIRCRRGLCQLLAVERHPAIGPWEAVGERKQLRDVLGRAPRHAAIHRRRVVAVGEGEGLWELALRAPGRTDAFTMVTDSQTDSGDAGTHGTRAAHGQRDRQLARQALHEPAAGSRAAPCTRRGRRSSCGRCRTGSP